MIDYDLLIIVIASLLFLVVIGGTILLFPVSRKLGHLLEARARDPRAVAAADDEALRRVVARLDTLEEQVATLAERQEFVDRLLTGARPGPSLSTGDTD